MKVNGMSHVAHASGYQRLVERLNRFPRGAFISKNMKAFFAAVLILSNAAGAPIWASDKALAGCVSGTVVNAQTGRPVAGAGVYLLITKVCKLSGAKMSVRTERGEFLLPHVQNAAVKAITDERGFFLMKGVPVPQSFKSYTVFIRAAGYADFVIHDAAVYADPEKALHINCRLSKGKLYAVWFEGSSPEAPVSYRPD